MVGWGFFLNKQKKDRSQKENGRKLEIKGLLVKQINGV